jgi:hypothetical protein
MIVFNPDFFLTQLSILISLLCLFVIQVVLALIRYGKMTTFHTYGAKLAAVTQGVFLVLFFFTPQPIMPLFYIAAIITGIELLEEIVIVLIMRNGRPT